jgi:DNA invertase Pin-like site-specific DNA recombinase
MTHCKRIAIYCRYSCELQSPTSCRDQEREVRAALTRQGIDHSTAIAIYDEAETGTTFIRPGLNELLAMLARGEVWLTITPP